MTRFLLHYGIHFIAPFFIAYFGYKTQFKRVLGILLLGICIDIDHVLATPIFASNRCSIGFHPLHSYIAICFYILLLAPHKTRVFGIALLLHILADSVDCILM